MDDPIIGIAILCFSIWAVGTFSVFIKCYRRCPPNTIIIRTGMGGTIYKTQNGGRWKSGILVVPIIHYAYFFSLDPFKIEIEPQYAALLGGNKVFTIKISDKPSNVAALKLSRIGVNKIKTYTKDLILSISDEMINTTKNEPSSLSQRIEDKLNEIGLTLVAKHK